jgi:cytochrome c oxidase cbb3-type subunit III
LPNQNEHHSHISNPAAIALLAAICAAAAALSGLAQNSFLFAAAQQHEETKNPLAGNAQAIREGGSQFRADCALCHGLDARGGNRGPDLTRGTWAHGGTDADLFRTISLGIPGTLMPANDLSEAETWEIIAYLRSLAPSKPRDTSGDPKAGEEIFYGEGNCSLCHMVRGKGGRLGPDLTHVMNRRSPEFIEKKVRDPNANLSPTLMDSGKEWPYDAQSVTIVTKDGQKIQGIIRNEDTFTIQLMDISETLYSFSKKDLREVTHEEKTLMPAYGTETLSDAQVRNLIAFLDHARVDSAGDKK